MRIRSVAAAFDRGQVPRIACFRKGKTPMGVALADLVGALQRYVDEHVAPVWGTPARLVRSTGFLKGAWAMAFLEDADVAGALAYHDLTPDGFPLSKIFVRTTLSRGSAVSVSASHELAEMLVDPAVNLFSTGPRPKRFYAYESVDPVQEDVFDVDGIPVSDFVYPSYFETFRKKGSTKFDHEGKVDKPFQLRPGGYQIVFENGRFSEVFGSRAAARKHEEADLRGCRGIVSRRQRHSRARGPYGHPV
jgi:hypothetical protein